MLAFILIIVQHQTKKGIKRYLKYMRLPFRVAWYHRNDAICCWNRRHVSFFLFYSNDIVCI